VRCDLTPAFELSGPTISHHLKALREAGLVDSDRRGTWVCYRARPGIMRQLAALLTDVLITMGCGDVCPVFPGKRYLDWKLDDPAGQGLDAVRPIRDAIKARVEQLLTELPVKTD
jgi:DNA-binding transcriptional ArsR family regulator